MYEKTPDLNDQTADQMPEAKQAPSHRRPVAYKNDGFLDSPAARPLRILSEYLEPLSHFRAEKVYDTVVFFGSARIAEDGPMGHYYRDARTLARLITMIETGAIGSKVAKEVFEEMTTSGEARTAQGLWVTGDFFNGLGVPALVGRTLTTDDDRRGCAAPAAVLGYGFWQREYGGDPSVIGRSITLDGHPFPIVGVTPASFFGVEVGRAFDVAVPLCAEPISRGTRSYIQSSIWKAVPTSCVAFVARCARA